MAEQTSCLRDVEDALGAELKRLLLYGLSGIDESFAAPTMGEPTMSRRLVCTQNLTSGDMLGTWMPNGSDRWGFWAKKAMFDMVPFGNGKLDVEPAWQESL